MAKTALFFVGDEASYICGADLALDGGISMGSSPRFFQAGLSKVWCASNEACVRQLINGW